jgi:N-acetylmuramic acid 6-phosphate etherase
MTTETVSHLYRDFDLWGNAKALEALLEGQAAAISSLGPILAGLGAAVDAAAPRLRRGGRLIYAGAGTSARIGVQDGAELFPTFNWPHEQVAFAIAGGEGALLRAVENAEDSAEDGVARIEELGVGAHDVVIGLAASGNTPYTVAAVKTAKARGALTVGIANNPATQLLAASDHPILLDTGPEIIAGSTRLKAGTAQKAALNLFSTLLMVRLGRVYGGLMVHMRPTNEKLRRRGVQMIARIVGCQEDAAAAAFAKADGDVKLGVLIARGADRARGEALLEKHDGNLRAALAEAFG